MQLNEYFIWRNVKNAFYNKILSALALILLFLQPIAALMILNDKQLRTCMIFSYICISVIFQLYLTFTSSQPEKMLTPI